MLRRDNVKTKDRPQTLFFIDLRWEIVLYCNCAIMSQYFFFKCSLILHTEILNFQCPGVTRINISTRISQECDLRPELFDLQEDWTTGSQTCLGRYVGQVLLEL